MNKVNGWWTQRNRYNPTGASLTNTGPKAMIVTDASGQDYEGAPKWCVPGTQVREVANPQNGVYTVMSPPVWSSSKKRWAMVVQRGTAFPYTSPCRYYEPVPEQPETTTVPGLGTYDTEELREQLAGMREVEG
jgi:hypothetical protein